MAARLFSVRVLDRLGLVKDQQPSVDLSQHRHAQQRAGAGNHQMSFCASAGVNHFTLAAVIADRSSIYAFRPGTKRSISMAQLAGSDKILAQPYTMNSRMITVDKNPAYPRAALLQHLQQNRRLRLPVARALRVPLPHWQHILVVGNYGHLDGDAP